MELKSVCFVSDYCLQSVRHETDSPVNVLILDKFIVSYLAKFTLCFFYLAVICGTFVCLKYLELLHKNRRIDSQLLESCFSFKVPSSFLRAVRIMCFGE